MFSFLVLLSFFFFSTNQAAGEDLLNHYIMNQNSWSSALNSEGQTKEERQRQRPKPKFTGKDKSQILAVIAYLYNSPTPSEVIEGKARFRPITRQVVRETGLDEGTLNLIRLNLTQGKGAPQILKEIAEKREQELEAGMVVSLERFDKRIAPYCSELPKSTRGLLGALWEIRYMNALKTQKYEFITMARKRISDEEAKLQITAVRKQPVSDPDPTHHQVP